MDTKERDQYLLKEGVKFLPWIGKDYEYGLSYDEDGKLFYGTKENLKTKILVLGESHYVGEEEAEEFKSGKDQELWANFTREVIKNYLDVDTEWDRWKNTFLKFERSIAGFQTKRSDSPNIWNHLAFYNYLQVPKSDSRMAPTNDELSLSVKPFFKLLDEIKPDVVIVWGKRLYWLLLGDYEELDVTGEEGEPIIEDDYKNPTWIYKENDGHIIRLLPVIHPSWGYSWDYWFKIIRKEIEK